MYGSTLRNSRVPETAEREKDSYMNTQSFNHLPKGTRNSWTKEKEHSPPLEVNVNLPTLRSGKPRVNLGNLLGARHGVKAAQDGILNVRSWLPKYLDGGWMCIREGWT